MQMGKKHAEGGLTVLEPKSLGKRVRNNFTEQEKNIRYFVCFPTAYD